MKHEWTSLGAVERLAAETALSCNFPMLFLCWYIQDVFFICSPFASEWIDTSHSHSTIVRTRKLQQSVQIDVSFLCFLSGWAEATPAIRFIKHSLSVTLCKRCLWLCCRLKLLWTFGFCLVSNSHRPSFTSASSCSLKDCCCITPLCGAGTGTEEVGLSLSE